MTISTTVTSIQFDGNDSTLDFEFPAKVFDESDLLVQLYTDGVWQTLTFPAQYTVSIDLDGIATVTPTQVVAAGEILDIRSNIELLQPTDIKTLGRFLPEIHENVFDRLLRQIQDLSRKVSASVRYPDNESTDGEAPVIASRSGRYLFANALTGAFEWVTSIATTALSQSIFNQYQADSDPYKRTAAEIAAGVTPTDYAYPSGPVVPPERFGAVGDGVTDDSASFQAVIDYLAQLPRGGMMVLDTTKSYYWASTLNWADRVWLIGNHAQIIVGSQDPVIDCVGCVGGGSTASNARSTQATPIISRRHSSASVVTRTNFAGTSVSLRASNTLGYCVAAGRWKSLDVAATRA